MLSNGENIKAERGLINTKWSRAVWQILRPHLVGLFFLHNEGEQFVCGTNKLSNIYHQNRMQSLSVK